jgi:hypothetical protein
LKELAGLGMRDWIVVLDCCYGFTAGRRIIDRLADVVGRSPGSRAFVLTSADALDEADAGVFTGVLSDVLRRGPEEGWWGYPDKFLDWQTVEDHLFDMVPGRPQPHTVGSTAQILPNPMYRPSGVAGGSYDESHFLPKAQGIEAGESGWYFTGRRDVLNSVLGWLHREGEGIAVVTGSAGTGKSAILGRLITLSVPAYLETAPEHVLTDAPIPDIGDIQIAFHAREKSVDDLLAFLAKGLGLDEYRDVSDLYEPLRLAAGHRGDRPYVIAIDALDEAMGTHGRRMVNELLLKVGNQPGVKVLIGSRPGVVDWRSIGVSDENIYDLDLDPSTRDDIADYVARRLPRIAGSSYRDASPDDEDLERIAAAVANASTTAVSGGPEIGSFLVARVISKTLAGSPPLDIGVPGWEEAMPEGLDAAFERDLTAYGERHGKATEQLIRGLLEALAWDEGQGIPRRHIPAVAQAVTGHIYSDDDITTLLRLAGGHITETEQVGWATYRLYHERFREYLRDVTIERLSNDKT